MNKSIWGNTVKPFNKMPAGNNHSDKLLWQFAINICMCLIFLVSCMPNFSIGIKILDNCVILLILINIHIPYFYEKDAL